MSLKSTFCGLNDASLPLIFGFFLAWELDLDE